MAPWVRLACGSWRWGLRLGGAASGPGDFSLAAAAPSPTPQTGQGSLRRGTCYCVNMSGNGARGGGPVLESLSFSRGLSPGREVCQVPRCPMLAEPAGCPAGTLLSTRGSPGGIEP